MRPHSPPPGVHVRPLMLRARLGVASTVLPGWAGHGLCLLYPRCLCLLPQDRVPPRAGRGSHEEAVPCPVLHVPHLPSPAGRPEVLPERWAPPVRTLLPGEPPRPFSRCQALSGARRRHSIISSPTAILGGRQSRPISQRRQLRLREGRLSHFYSFPVASVTTLHQRGGSNSTQRSSDRSEARSPNSVSLSQNQCGAPGRARLPPPQLPKPHSLHSLVPLSGFRVSREHLTSVSISFCAKSPSASYKDTCDGI